jgi:transcriptional regulator with XRE-family HTH domain
MLGWHSRIVESVPDSRSHPPVWEAFAIELGHNLQRARLARGLSQEQVAYRARLSRFTYQKYENGLSRPGQTANPTLRSLLAIAQVLDTTLVSLLPADPPDLTAR